MNLPLLVSLAKISVLQVVGQSKKGVTGDLYISSVSLVTTLLYSPLRIYLSAYGTSFYSVSIVTQLNGKLISTLVLGLPFLRASRVHGPRRSGGSGRFLSRRPRTPGQFISVPRYYAGSCWQ